jgi:response regulator RpfG family c-di-GMP phosphodiesterase
MKVLMVDDDEETLEVFRGLLEKESFELELHFSPEDALNRIHQETFAVIVSDREMPSMDGITFLEKSRDVSPRSIRIMLTGKADLKSALEGVNRGSLYRFLTKPWNDEELRLTIRQAVAQFELESENKRLTQVTQDQNVELTRVNSALEHANSELQKFNQSLEQKVTERTQEISVLLHKLEQSVLGTVEVLGGVGEMHSSVVGTHAKRVSSLARQIGMKMELTWQELFELEIAAMLHDIGKIMLPSNIVSADRESHTPKEKEILALHVVWGESILKLVPNLGDAPKIVRHHHENFDGSGYPNKFANRNIPLGSRIIAVVNAYDNILNGRKDFGTTKPETALLFIQDQSSKQFDPAIVSLFIKFIRSQEDSEEVEVRLNDLRLKMKLSREVCTVRGIRLLAKDTVIEEKHLERLRHFLETDPFVDSFYIYRHRV